MLASDVLYDGETVEAFAMACKSIIAEGGMVSDPNMLVREIYLPNV